MQFVCPLPMPWAATHQRLCCAWDHCGRPGDPPPVPLILGGWGSSNDVEKYERWTALVGWAKRNGLGHLLPELADDEKYVVYRMTDYVVGPLGGPMYLPWDFTEKERPDDASVVAALSKLQTHWSEVAGGEMATHTEPIRFSGQKLRRLLVRADPSNQPPWGTWARLDPGENRRSFTRLRAAINALIAPLVVDHVDFEEHTTDRA